LRRLAGRSFEDVDPRGIGWMPLIVSACAYAAVSGSFWTLWPAGLLYGLAYRRRGRLGDAIVAHAVANFLAVVFSSGITPSLR
jgi:membrane protease YdiL (CAAX protease family)